MNEVLARIEDQILNDYLERAYPEFKECEESEEYDRVIISISEMDDNKEYSFESEDNWMYGYDWKTDPYLSGDEYFEKGEWAVR